jgi:Putative peptidoglycan binding domain
MGTPDAVPRRQSRAVRPTPRCAALLLTAALVLRAGPAAAAPGGTALVIGDGQYPGQSLLPACSQAAHAVAARLRRLGYAVDQAIDVPASAVRDVLDSFATHVAAVPEQPTLVYVCAQAAAVGSRLFVLPSDVDLRETVRPETQGIVVRTLFRILAGTQGSLVMEFGVPAGTSAASAATTLRQALPDGLHLALTIGDGRQAGAFGRRLASDATDPAQGWESLAAALRGAGPDAASATTVFAPAPTPAALAPSAPAPAALAPPAPNASSPAPAAGLSAAETHPGAAAPQPGVAAPVAHPSEPGRQAQSSTGSAPSAGPVASAGPAPGAGSEPGAGPASGAGSEPGAGPVASAGPESGAGPTLGAGAAPDAGATPAPSPSAPPPTGPAPSAPHDSGGPHDSGAPHDSAAASSPHDVTETAPPPAATVPARPAHNQPPASVPAGSGNARAAHQRPPERVARSPEAIPDARIRRLQAALALRGFYRGPLDGAASLGTLQAIRAFQAAVGDPPTGGLTQTEIVRLLNNW